MVERIEDVAGLSGWAAVAPAIQARQQLMLERRAGGTETDRAVPETANAGKTQGEDANGLTRDEQAVVENLKARDREVRDHEQAHARVGGQYAGQPSYSYETGPDGNRYAVAGEVPIDVSPVPENPEATINKMEIVKAAALAPAEPSSADRQVAALADAQKMQAIADLNKQRAEQRLDLSV